MVSDVQGLDQKQNFQPFIGLVRVKECISGILGIQGIKHVYPNMVRVLVSGKIQKQYLRSSGRLEMIDSDIRFMIGPH